MKVNRKGEIKLEKGEIRIGNYVLKEEKEHIKIQDINGMISWRFNSAFIGKGMFYKEMIARVKEGAEFAEDALKNVIFTDHYVLSAVLDPDSMIEIVKTTTEQIKKHPELYGLDPDMADEDDEKQLDAVKDLETLQEEISAKIEAEEKKEQEVES